MATSKHDPIRALEGTPKGRAHRPDGRGASKHYDISTSRKCGEHIRRRSGKDASASACSRHTESHSYAGHEGRICAIAGGGSVIRQFGACTKRTYHGVVGFEWDEENKAGVNFRKHAVRIPEAIPVFDDPYAITVTDEESDPDERRFVTLGIGATGRLLVVVYTLARRQ
ncbi:MAG: hypothetical protein K0R61_5628, partial [Microvirga sp.]|nr:hypothetical protein [Microvirga sp.]